MARKQLSQGTWILIALLLSACGHREHLNFQGPELKEGRSFAFIGGLENTSNIWYKVNYATNVFNRGMQEDERGQFKSFGASDFIDDTTIQDRVKVTAIGKHSGAGEIVTVQDGNAVLSIHFTFETTIGKRPWLIFGQVQELTEQGTRKVMEAIMADLEIVP